MTDTEAGTPPDPITALRVLASLVNRDIEGQFEEISGYALDDVMLRLDASRPATDPAGLDAPCERSLAGLLCDLHGGAYWPSLTDRCNGWIALAAARLSVADGPGPEERLREALEQALDRFDRIGEHLLPTLTPEDREVIATQWWFGSEELRAALARPLPENREEPSR